MDLAIEASLKEEREVEKIFFQASDSLLVRSRKERLCDRMESGVTYLVELALQ